MFHDPPAVELMTWIKYITIAKINIQDKNFQRGLFYIKRNQTPKEASFAGSMQLLAGVKCTTGRRVTNHPHFEDRILRDATREVTNIQFLLSDAFLLNNDGLNLK